MRNSFQDRRPCCVGNAELPRVKNEFHTSCAGRCMWPAAMKEASNLHQVEVSIRVCGILGSSGCRPEFKVQKTLNPKT